MTIEHRAEIRVTPAPAEVFSYLVDLPSNLPSWAKGVNGVEPITPGPTRSGSRFLVRGKVFGIAVSSPYEVVALEPERLLRGRGVAGPFRFDEAYEIAGSDDRASSVVTYEMEAHGRGPFRLIEAILARKLRTLLDGDLERLRARLSDPSAH